MLAVLVLVVAAASVMNSRASGEQPTTIRATTSQAATSQAAAKDHWNSVFSDGLLDASGKEVSLDQVRGKLVAVYFSAKWCVYCRKFTPTLVAFRDKNADKFEVVYVGYDHTADEKASYMADDHMKWPTVPYKSASSKALSEKFGIKQLPTLVVLSPKGNIVSTDGVAELAKSGEDMLAKWQEKAKQTDK
jgi:nucleoredoxin